MKDLTDAMLTEDEFLEHFGVKGMKWGKRKAENSSSPNKTHTSADAARVNKLKARVASKGTDNLSNDDLAKLNKRAQLMSEYKKNNPTTFKKGQNALKEVVATRKDVLTIIAAGTAIAAHPLARKGAKAAFNAFKNMSTSAPGSAPTAPFSMVVKAIGS